MQLRSSDLYVSKTTRRGLRYAARRLSVDGNRKTADAVADMVISQWLEKEMPDIVQHIVASDAAENEFLKTLGGEDETIT